MRVLCLMAVLCSLLTGCVALVAGGAGAGAVAFAKGEYAATYQRSYEQVWAAAADTMKEMGITLYNTSKGGGLMEGKKSDGQNVRLVLQSLGPDSTEIKSRVGNLGDEDYSRQIDQKIQQRLAISK